LRYLRKRNLRKVNLYRYLAATQYRLKKYDKATEALAQGLDLWPDDISLREQLATTLEASGNVNGAYNCWQEIRRREPGHARAAQRMKEITGSSHSPAGPVALGHKGAVQTPSSELVCGGCGARNATEFDRCWQCHAELQGAERAAPEQAPQPASSQAEPPAPASARSQADRPSPGWVLGAGWLGAGLLYGGTAYLVVHRHIDAGPAASAIAVAEAQLLSARWAASAAGLVFAASLGVLLPLLFTSVRLPRGRTALLATLLGGLAFAAGWISLPELPRVGAGLAVAALPLWLLMKPEMGWGRQLASWLIALAVTTIALAGAAFAVAGAAPFAEYRRIVEQGRQTPVYAETLQAPGAHHVIWTPNASDWLTQHAPPAEVTIAGGLPEDGYSIALTRDGQVVHRAQAVAFPHAFSFEPAPNEWYRLEIEGQLATLKVTSAGLLPFRFAER
jgi:hypothetical protein